MLWYPANYTPYLVSVSMGMWVWLLTTVIQLCYYIQQWGVVPEKVGEKRMSVRGLVSVVIGVVAFVVIDSLITNIITGTDTGSVNTMALGKPS